MLSKKLDLECLSKELGHAARAVSSLSAHDRESQSKHWGIIKHHIYNVHAMCDTMDPADAVIRDVIQSLSDDRITFVVIHNHVASNSIKKQCNTTRDAEQRKKYCAYADTSQEVDWCTTLTEVWLRKVNACTTPYLVLLQPWTGKIKQIKTSLHCRFLVMICDFTQKRPIPMHSVYDLNDDKIGGSTGIL